MRPLLALAALTLIGLCSCPARLRGWSFERYVLKYESPVDVSLQAKVEEIDASLRRRYGMTTEQTAVGVLDLRVLRLAMIHPDRIEYAASVPKIGILLAYFQVHPEAATRLDAVRRHELGLMVKASSNEMAAKYSRQLGLQVIQGVLNDAGFYDRARGRGLWLGLHYGKGDERYPDPVGDHSHAATTFRWRSLGTPGATTIWSRWRKRLMT
ncbi:MAG: hypothetical protein KA354_07055 [Phycisphaerae bacterium]|nr:hypothetical protein [Phycisphaerae bacterium]